MSPVERIKELPYPEKKFESHEDAWEYCKELRRALQEEQSERVEDFDVLKMDNIGWEDVRAYAKNETKQDGLANAISKISTTETTLLIPNQQDVTASATVPSTMTLRFVHGGSLNISSTKTVTINGQVEAGLYQIFEGSGTASFGAGSVEYIYPEWWGIDGTADNLEIDKAITAAAINSEKGITVKFSQMYTTTGVITGKPQVSIEGNGYDTGIQTTACNGISIDTGQYVGATSYRNFFISGDSSSTVAITCVGTSNHLVRAYGYLFENLRISNFATGIRIRSMWQSTIRDCNLTTVWTGIAILGQCTNILVDKCVMSLNARSESGNSRGIIVDHTADYDPGGSTSYRPEFISIKHTLIYGFEYGIDWERCLVGHIEDCDIDAVTLYGIYFLQKEGGLTIRDNWIYLTGAAGLNGIYGIALGSASNSVGLISHNEIQSSNDLHATSVGIKLSTNQNNMTIEHNLIYDFEAYDIYVSANSACKIIGNTCQSTAPTYSIYIAGTASRTMLGKNTCAKLIEMNPATLGTELEVVSLDRAAVTKGTSGTGEDDLYSTVIRADTLQLHGINTRGHQGIHIVASGLKVGSNGNKTIKLHFGSGSETVFPAANNTNNWILEAWIISQTSVGPWQSVVWQFNDNGTITMNRDTSWQEDLTSDVTVKLTGECAHADDIIYQVFWLVERF